MEEYISKSALVAEINKLKNISLEYGYTTEQRIVANVGKDLTLKRLFDYIDTLEVKGVDSNDDFIEKAWDWVEDNLLSSNQQDKSLLYYEQFKKYLEK